MVSKVTIRLRNLDQGKSRKWYMEELRQLGDIVGAHFRMVRGDNGWVYNRDAVIQFRHPEQARAAIRQINGSSIGNTRDHTLVADEHFEEFNLRALDEVMKTSVKGPRVSISANPEYMLADDDYWNVSPKQGIPFKD